jgi:hypothetical protein
VRITDAFAWKRLVAIEANVVTRALNSTCKGNVDKPQVALTAVICGKDNLRRTADSTPVRGVPLPSNAFTSARDFVVAELPREDKERLLRELARECGYLLEPATYAPEDFQRKLFVDNNE